MTGPDMLERPLVLVVDDTPDNLTLIHGLLRDDYRLKVATTGERAITIARSDPQPDLVLLDVMMPGLSGYEVCDILQADPHTEHIPIVFLTAMSSPEDEARSLAKGAVDFIAKPVNPPVLRARVRTQLEVKRAADILRDRAFLLEAQVAERTREISAVRDVTIQALASLAETRDNETGNHILRTQLYVKALAEALQDHPRFADTLDDATIELLYKSAPLHDIGKVGILDAILLKPGKLTPAEFEVMKTHARLGRDALQSAEDRLGTQVDFLVLAKEIAYCHHEKWDGSGYPSGLRGDEIPISARLMAVADVYDALISHRPYKKPFPHEVAVEMLQQGRGKHFDPDVVDAFMAREDEMKAIAARHCDGPSTLPQIMRAAG